MASPRKPPARPKLEIGWREIIALPDWQIDHLRCKIDTGARTSALHATDVEPYEHGGKHWVRFHVLSKDVPGAKWCEARVRDRRQIKNTSGVPEYRYIIATNLVLGRRHWLIEVSLADRENMEFDMILGRTALKGRRIVINPGRSFLAGQPVFTPSARQDKAG